MTPARKRPSLAFSLYVVIAITLCGYFAFASMQGENGLFQRLQFEAERDELASLSGNLDDQLGDMRNKTLRLSDSYLDLDLLDEQVRDVLGYTRADEVIIR